MIELSAFKRNFFDSEAVLKRLSKAERKVFSRFGAFVRRRARSSIRRSKKVSQPGKPPFTHTKNQAASIRFILFSYDPDQHSVVIGPAKLNKPGQTPEVLEKGGDVTVKRKVKGRTVRKVMHYAPRPFMGPAFTKEQNESLPAMWRDAI